MKIICLLAVMLSFNVVACGVDQEVEKLYIPSKDISIQSGGIFVKMQDQWFRTPAVFSNTQGMYIETLWPQEDGCRKGFVPCRNCDRCIPSYHHGLCPLCGRPA
jgi:hypothetical protein